MTDLRNNLKEYFKYVDGKLIWKKIPYNARRIKIGDVAGFMSGDYMTVCLQQKTYSLHRMIFLYHYGYLPDFIDHIDGNRLNNRIENLRECTQSQNSYNARLRKDNKSGVKGVCWHKARKRWLASIRVNNKSKHVGWFKTLQSAKKAVDSAREKLHGEFANCGGVL